MKDFFKPEDFDRGFLFSTDQSNRIHVASIANAKLNAEIEKWPVVYGNLNKKLQGNWCEDIESTFIKANSTHTARLAFIEEIKPKECEHHPFIYNLKCRKCGIKLRAKWEPAE